jgi:hypothetical protein
MALTMIHPASSWFEIGDCPGICPRNLQQRVRMENNQQLLPIMGSGLLFIKETESAENEGFVISHYELDLHQRNIDMADNGHFFCQIALMITSKGKENQV